MGVIKHWKRLTTDIVESSSLEIFRIQLDMILSNLFLWSCSEQEVGPDNLQRYLPVSAVLGVVKMFKIWGRTLANISEYHSMEVTASMSFYTQEIYSVGKFLVKTYIREILK